MFLNKLFDSEFIYFRHGCSCKPMVMVTMGGDLQPGCLAATLHLSPMAWSSYKESSDHTIASHPSSHMFSHLPRDIICSTARFRLRVHTLRFETTTWNQSNCPTCDLCDADDIQDEQHVLFQHCVKPHVISLCRKYASLFPQTGAHHVSSCLCQNSISKLVFLP